MPEFSPAFLHSLNFVIRPDVEGGYHSYCTACRSHGDLSVSFSLMGAK